MKPRVKLAETKTPDCGTMELFQHDADFSIRINDQELMNSRRHESELELARLGCAHLVDRKSPKVLIGGLGMGYTLRQTLDMLSRHAEVVVGELLKDVVQWNREYLGHLNDQPLNDRRVEINQGDVVKLISRSTDKFDAILLDIDNGAGAVTDAGNGRLYNRKGIEGCRRALRQNGTLAFWSSDPRKRFEQLLMSCRFHVRRYRAPPYKGSKSRSHYIWVASEEVTNLPPGGGEPRPPDPSNKKRPPRRQRR